MIFLPFCPRSSAWLLASLYLAFGATSQGGALEEKTTRKETTKITIGATAVLQEISSGSAFKARIDTGARTCSLHIEEILFDNTSDKMRENIGKMARFRIKNGQDKDHWIEEKIISTAQIKTSGKKERRYKVWLTLRYGDVQKRVKVTLNDRSQMEFPLLIGRNFLCNDFVVDVSLDGD